jgi:hypothetical protein
VALSPKLIPKVTNTKQVWVSKSRCQSIYSATYLLTESYGFIYEDGHEKSVRTLAIHL